MTYFEVLLVFVFPPLALLFFLGPLRSWRAARRSRRAADRRPYFILLAIAIIALIYTTPWDNYLVATGVWWYDPALVTGIRLGWVPLEEYTFFVLQTLLTGLWTWVLWDTRRLKRVQNRPSRKLRYGAGLATSILWGLAILALVLGGQGLTYLALILAWALFPVTIQVLFGADILYSKWRIVLAAILIPTLYLWLVDAVALGAGTWTIDPVQTTGLKVGVLPIEEMVFFLMTNVLIVLGFVLMRCDTSQARLDDWLVRWRQRAVDPQKVTRVPSS